MQFNSTAFLLFLPTVVVAYYLLTPPHRRLLLLLASYCFYWVWSVPFSGLLVLSTVVDYAAARIIDGSARRSVRRAGLLASVVVNLGILALFKYVDFFSDSTLSLFGVRPWPELDWVLPLGISFYTFQTMSYTIDVYRGALPARRSLLDVALYVSFFPQLVAGPIVRGSVLLPQLAAMQRFEWENIRRGIAQILWGMAKKVYVADTVAHIVNDAYGSPGTHSGVALVVATYAFAVQIYCDFSGYSDIAIGAARLLGIRLPENFNSPYLAYSMREFWRRWHISLSTWLRDYLYIPLGGSRRGPIRTYVNLMITMLLGGLWHGAGWNWVLWGGAHGVALAAERRLGVGETPPTSPIVRVLRWGLTFHFVCITWVLFRAENLGHAGVISQRIVTLSPGSFTPDVRAMVAVVVLLAAEAAGLRRRWLDAWALHPVLVRWATYAAFAALYLTFAKAPHPEFIYFQF